MSAVRRLLFNLYQLLTWPLWALLRRARRRGGWVELSLHGAVHELGEPRPRGLLRFLTRLRPRPVSLAELRALGERVGADPHVAGILVNLTALHAGWASLMALHAALLSVADKGKKVVVMLPEGGSQRELLVAAAASIGVAPPSASFSLLGPIARRPYVAPLLARVGLKVEVTAEGRFKTAAESLAQDRMSDFERQQSGALVETLKESLAAGLARKLKVPSDVLFERALFDAVQAREAGLLDAVGYRDEAEASLGFPAEKHTEDVRAYLRRTRPRKLVPLRSPSRFAVLKLQGPIGDISSRRSIAHKPTLRVLQALAERRDVSGVLLYLDTPGGSAAVSDLLHHEVQRLAREKPVVAWMDNVAASGGYYLAAAAQRIVAHECTITGSIGVISVQLVAAELLSRLGIRSEAVMSTPHADLGNIARPPTEAERALLRASSRRFYERFLAVVAEGRRLAPERVAELAEGRVWSGRDAHAVGLVDRLGGYPVALEELRTLLGAERAARVDFERPLVLQPRAEPGRLWAGAQVGALGAAAREVVELALQHGPMLAYAPPPV